MDDREVVRILAEYMDIWPHDAIGDVFPIGSGFAVAVPMGGARIARHFPDYTRDYNALAPVWDKAWEMQMGLHRTTIANKALIILGVGPDEGYALRLYPGSSPRAHAHALAQAIKESQHE